MQKLKWTFSQSYRANSTHTHTQTPPSPHTFTPQPCRFQHLYLCLSLMFSSAHHMFTSLSKALSVQEVVESLAPAQVHHPFLQHVHSLPQRTHPTLFLSKGYPSALQQNSSMFSGEAVFDFFLRPSLRRPRPSPHPIQPKTLQTIKGSWHWSLSSNLWQVPLGYYHWVNGRVRGLWHSRDGWGFRGVHLHEQALLHQLHF